MAGRGTNAAITSFVLCGIALLFVVARLAGRKFLVKQIGVDDVFIFAAVCFSFGLTATIEIQSHYGLGAHVQDVLPGQYATMYKGFFVGTFFYSAALAAAKISILIQFLRFFRDKGSRIVAWGLIGLVSTYCLICWIATACACQPIAMYWDPRVRGGHCFQILTFWLFSAGFHIVTDLALWILPIPTLVALQMPHRQKYSLIGIFALGGFGCVTSMLRLQKLYVLTKSRDPTYDLLEAILWSSIEVNTGIVCACLPTLKPVVNWIFPKLLGNNSRHRSRQRSQQQTPSILAGKVGGERTSDATEQSDSITLCDEEMGLGGPQQHGAERKSVDMHTLEGKI
ncbi:hypothetical protein PV11_08576 [Exophiala sideris]|uniref:Rhodopsin domain-containing protein n=1 Tax=Exophiala sideris TaxID=1016849 RepID=A0A0D1X0Z7_9EURO|nr:hypothetical protein PV11_08576 [Exophiala sideris]